MTVHYARKISGDLILGGNLYPDADNTRDIGKTGLEFKDIHIDGTGNIDALSPPSTVHFTTRNTSGDTTVAGTRYLGVDGIDAFSNTEYFAKVMIGKAGTFKNLRVKSKNAPGAGEQVTITLRVNEADVNLTVTLGATDVAKQDLANTDVISQDDYVSWKIIGSGGAAATVLYITVDFEPA